MALDITTLDITIDETTGIQNDDVNPAVLPHSTNTTLQYLLTLDDPNGLASPEVAFKADFVQVTATEGETITSVFLAQDDTGTPFSTTDGVNSGIRTVDGNYVWLFLDPTHANVVIGVIGTSDLNEEPAAGGDLAFSFALISNGDSGDLYTVQYVPLFHPDPNNPDDPDTLDLSNVVFASASGTISVSFSGEDAAPGIHEFYLINSPDDASKQLLVTGFARASQTDTNSALLNADANVSSQGFGVENQSIEPDTDGAHKPLGREVLQVDFVTGGTLPAGDGVQIDYDNHLDDIKQAGFTVSQLTPSAPNGRVDIRISAFDVTVDEQGAEFFNGSPATAVNITSLTLTGQSGFDDPITEDGTYNVAGNVDVTVSGLGTGVVTITGLDNTTTVDITTTDQMDRLRVEAIDANEGLDISEFHFSGESTNAVNVDVGAFINFDDDGPSIDPSQAAVPTLTVDETTFATDASASFAGLFTSAFGADGFKDADNNNTEDADAISYKLGVSAANVASGLVDTLTNEAVTLSVNAAGTVVTGASATGGTVFTITLNADTGAVTLDQVRAVVHGDPTDPDEADTPAVLSAANLVTLTATITDGDLDTDFATRNIGDAFKFEDDGPSIDPSAAVVPTLMVDETDFATNASASFAGLFTPGAFGADGFKDADNNNVEDADAISYKLGVSAANVASGLVDTLTNEAVTLSVNAAGTVVTGASATGGTVFTITLNADTGAVTLDQVRAVVHGDPTDPDEADTPAVLSAANLVTLTATITDGDLDTDIATRNIGDAFKFEDDGPSIDPSAAVVPTLVVDETDFATNASASFAGLFTPGAFGADGFKDADNNNAEDADAISYKLGVSAANVASGLVDTLTNEAVTLSVNATGTVVTGASATGGTVFTITLNADTGAVTLDQVRAVVHGDPTDPDEADTPAVLSAANLVTLTATITDGDLDTDFATRNIGDAFKFEDDGPSIDPSAAVVPTLVVDETDFATNASASFAGLFTPGAFGADGFKDADNNNAEDADAISYKLGVSAANVASGLVDTLTNEAVTLSVNAAGTVVTGASATGGTVFTITVNVDTGAVTLDQVRAVVHGDPTDPDEADTPAVLSAANLVTLTATITDGDLDTDFATRNIGDAFKFEDDGPSLTPQPPNDLQVGNVVGSTDSSSYELVPGTDGQKSYTLVGPEDSSGDFKWTYDDDTLTAITGTYNGDDLYTLELNSNTGGYTFTMTGELPGSTLDLSPAEVIKAGSPDNPILEIGAAQTDDFVRMSADSTVGTGNINESHGFVGVDNGNLDAGEALTFTLHEANGDLLTFEGIQIGTKSAQGGLYTFEAHIAGGELTDTVTGNEVAVKNGTIDISALDLEGETIDFIKITKVSGPATKIGIADIHIIIPPDDVQLEFAVELKDGDNDSAQQSFVVDIDGNNDGFIVF